MVRRFFMLVRLIDSTSWLPYDGKRTFRDGLRISCDGLRLVLPWSPPVDFSLQYHEKTKYSLVPIAQFGIYYLATAGRAVPAGPK